MIVAPEIDFSNQSYICDAQGVRTSQYIKDGPLIDKVNGKIDTYFQILEEGWKRYANRPYLGWRKNFESDYSWITYEEEKELVVQAGTGLKNLINGDDKTAIGIYAVNCVEWVLTEHACLCYNLLTVPVHETLGVPSLQKIINQTEMKIIVCDTTKRVENLKGYIDALPHLRYIILINPDEKLESLKEDLKDHVKIITYSELLDSGKTNQLAFTPSQLDDTIIICYTSGTTGLAKGVMLSNKNLMSMLGSTVTVYEQLDFTEIVHLSFLPLAHIFELFTQALFFYKGSKIGFHCGDGNTLCESAKILKPSQYMGVPRMMNRIYENYIAWKKQAGENADDEEYFSAMRETFGGNIKLVISGSAALSIQLKEFIIKLFKCPFIEGYGSTEACGSVTHTLLGDKNNDNVGPPIACCKVKLVDIPEMDIVFARDNKGEICVQGPNCTIGYYKEPESTKELIDEDKWIHTGDIGTWSPEGCLKIVGRRKNIFKLCQGEYVAPEKLEAIYSQSCFVDQIFVDGRSSDSYPVALVLANDKEARNFLEKKNIPIDSGSAVSKAKEDPDFEKLIIQDLRRLGIREKLCGFEMVKKIGFIDEAFTVENELLTPTFKVRRFIVKKKYADILGKIYEKKE